MKKTPIALAATVSLIIYSGYQLFSYPLSSRIDPRLVHTFNSIAKASEDNDVRSITIRGSDIEPNELSEELSGPVLDLLDSVNISSVYFSRRGEGNYSAALYVDRWFGFLRPRWYYRYSFDGRLEETIVPSLKEALKSDKYPYHYCEQAEVSHWYYCTAGDL